MPDEKDYFFYPTYTKFPEKIHLQRQKVVKWFIRAGMGTELTAKKLERIQGGES